jgi:hypothetical protein
MMPETGSTKRDTQWVYDPKWGYTSDGRRVWIEWWLTGCLKSVYTKETTDGR